MATVARYFDLVREMKDAYNHRLRLVENAKKRGIKPTARLFATTVPTVRKWLRRFEQRGPSGLVTLSRARHHQAQKTPANREAQFVELRKVLPTFGARRLIREFDLPIGHDALERIWREHGLIHKRRRKYQRKQDLAHIKASWALFQQISADTKDLDDIPRYWPQARRLHLPVVQYTARDVRSGLLFWAFAQARSASASAVFAARIQQHLDRYGVSLRDLVWQTDNGAEFKGDFPVALGDSQHVRIPPAAHTYQSDVETVHRLEEDEFFDLEDFSSRGEFLAKVHTYQLYFNIARPNSHKENQSPWQIIERLAPRSPLELCLLPPVFLDYYLNDSGGYDVGRLPYCFLSVGNVLLRHLPGFEGVTIYDSAARRFINSCLRARSSFICFTDGLFSISRCTWANSCSSCLLRSASMQLSASSQVPSSASSNKISKNIRRSCSSRSAAISVGAIGSSASPATISAAKIFSVSSPWYSRVCFSCCASSRLNSSASTSMRISRRSAGFPALPTSS